MKIKKRIVAVVLTLAMSVAMLSGAKAAPAKAASGPVSYYGQLEASGNRIVGENTGRPAQVKGMSYFWSNWSAKWWNAETLDRMVDEFKCDVVRCSYGVNDNGSVYDSSDETRLRQVIEAAIARDVYVIIDWHTHGAQKNIREAKSFFTEMAKDYGRYDNVIFELYNEPVQVDWATIKAYAEAVIPCIRTYSDNLILVGTPTWSQDVNNAADNPIRDENVAYVLHFYAGTHGQFLRDKGDYALSKGIPLFVSEWGSVNADGNGGIAYSSTEEWLTWMDQNKLSWCNWAINDKDETSSIFYSDGSLRVAGTYLKEILTTAAKKAEWRSATGNIGGGDNGNTGNDNTGNDNTGNNNTGNDNTGNDNTGNTPVVSGDIGFKYTVGNAWNSGYSAEIVLTNNTGSALKNWSLSFDWASKISAVYTGELSSKNGSYTIGCMSWNSTIAPGDSVSVQFQGGDTNQNKAMSNLVFKADGFVCDLSNGSGTVEPEVPEIPETPVTPEIPENPTTPEEPEVNEPETPAGNGSVSVEKDILNAWNGGYVAEFVITNHTDATVKNWKLSFDWASEISAVHTGMLSGNANSGYTISCYNWNSEIKPGETLRVSFQGADNKSGEAITNLVIKADGASYQVK